MDGTESSQQRLGEEGMQDILVTRPPSEMERESPKAETCRGLSVRHEPSTFASSMAAGTTHLGGSSFRLLMSNLDQAILQLRQPPLQLLPAHNVTPDVQTDGNYTALARPSGTRDSPTPSRCDKQRTTICSIPATLHKCKAVMLS